MSNALIAAIRGPIMLMTLGALFQFDHSGGASFRKTWPVLIIIYAVLKLGEALTARRGALPGDPLGGVR
jgi:hypothetical protein